MSSASFSSSRPNDRSEQGPLLDSEAMEPREAQRILERERERGLELIANSDSLEGLREAEVAVLGRKSPYSEVQRSLGALGDEDRRSVGRLANEVRAELEQAASERRSALEEAGETGLVEADRVDVTLPGRRLRRGSLHPLTIVQDEIVDIFTRMGYRVVEGPEVEDEWHNFDALNIPPAHPARDPNDNFYITDSMLLRSQTSTIQIRVMETQPPPVRVIAIGRVYRPDTTDATHSPMFHQIEGLCVDEGITMAHLKTVLRLFTQAYLGQDVQIRFRPSFFPFTEPSIEVDMSWDIRGGKWVELAGAGMVDPNVFQALNQSRIARGLEPWYDPEKYTGFAFGLGIERLCMRRHGIDDIRLFYQNDVRFLRQF